MPRKKVPVRAEAGIDWLTAIRPTGTDNEHIWLRRAYECVQWWIDAGNVVKPYVSLGYRGTGSKANFVGTREDGSIARFSSTISDRVWLYIVDNDTKVSRIDLQVTTYGEAYYQTKCRRAYKEATLHNSTLSEQYRRKVHQHTDDKYGHTVYVGRREGPILLRVYNKEAQSGEEHYKRAIRYEVQFNDDMAQRVSDMLRSRKGNRYDVIAATVADVCLERGISVPFAHNSELAITRALSHDKSDYARKLEWLERQVRPTISLLRDAGMLEEALVALGLKEAISAQDADRGYVLLAPSCNDRQQSLVPMVENDMQAAVSCGSVEAEAYTIQVPLWGPHDAAERVSTDAALVEA